jgi:predicted ABC-type transport system involved in lysophospholipase L1 biosynthesis ATPase subunit
MLAAVSMASLLVGHRHRSPSQLFLIGALDRPSQGELSVAGLSLGTGSGAEWGPYRRERVGFIFQSFHRLPTFSTMENVEMPLTLAEEARPARRNRALELLNSVGRDVVGNFHWHCGWVAASAAGGEP